jgi:hypothetical protein
MAFWNRRRDDEAAAELESAATGGLYFSPVGLVAAAVALLIVLLLLSPGRAPWTWGRLGEREPWIPRGEAVYASQRLADIEAQQRIADARAAAWEDAPAIDAHLGAFPARTPPG